MNLHRRDWWLGVLAIAAALLFHAAFPRYQVTVRQDGVFRTDRWTGRIEGARSLLDAPWAAVVR